MLPSRFRPIKKAQPMTKAIYARVSSNKQDIESQEPDLKAWEKSQTHPVKWFTETVSGKAAKRPVWEQVQDLIRRRKITELVVWRLDRLGRSASELTKLFDELVANNINLVSIKDGLDLSTPAGRLMANVLASVAQFETEIRAERIHAGIAAAKARGKKWGGRKKGSGKVTITIARTIFKMKEEGVTVTEIARLFKLNRTTVYRALREVA